MKIEDCQACQNHVKYQYGYVICNYFNTNEQRMTMKRDDGSLVLINCPKNDK